MTDATTKGVALHPTTRNQPTTFIIHLKPKTLDSEP
jgi:hypothetical protein